MKRLWHGLIRGFQIAMCIIVSGCWATNQEGVNDANTFRFRTRSSGDKLLLVDIFKVSSGQRIAEVRTDASVVHRFVLNWIAPDRILLISSDVGDRVITVGDVCTYHYADVLITPECAEAQLFDYSAQRGGKRILDTIKFDKNILLRDDRVDKKYLRVKDASAPEGYVVGLDTCHRSPRRKRLRGGRPQEDAEWKAKITCDRVHGYGTFEKSLYEKTETDSAYCFALTFPDGTNCTIKIMKADGKVVCDKAPKASEDWRFPSFWGAKSAAPL